MKKCLVLLLLAGSLRAETNFAQQAQVAWQNRDKPGQTEEAISLWDQAWKAEPGHPEILMDLTRACGRAVRHTTSRADEKRWAERAKIYGEKAVELNPKSSDAFACYAESLGQWAETHKGVHSLTAVRQAVGALKQSVELNPKNAYAHMLLASFYRQAPGLISVGDKEKAFVHAKLAVQYGPEAAINHLVLARVDLDRGLKDDAIGELQTIVALVPPPNAVPETLADQETARKLLADMGAAISAVPCGQTGGYCSEEERR